MEWKAVSGIIPILLLVGMIAVISNIQSAGASGTIFIRDDGSVEGTDKIRRDGNVYTFKDDISALMIVVERSDIIIEGAEHTLQGYGSGQGFYLSGVSNVTIEKTEIRDFDIGVQFSQSCDHSLLENHIRDNNYYGVILWDASDNVTISHNEITSNRNGVALWRSAGNMISGNNISSNSNFGIILDLSTGNTISGNSITSNNYWGIDCSGSSGNTISGNTIEDNWDGIYLGESSGNMISNNDIVSNEKDGIDFYGSSDNTIQGNNIAYNVHGILFSNSSNTNTVSGNNITDNKWDGIIIDESSGNRIYHNNFIDNDRQVTIYPSGYTNSWCSGCSPNSGNYWSDYTGDDANSDEIGDAPYIIDENNEDKYPLMSPWNSGWSPKTQQEFPFWMPWLPTIVLAAVAITGLVYFLKQRNPPTLNDSPPPTEDTAEYYSKHKFANARPFCFLYCCPTSNQGIS